MTTIDFDDFDLDGLEWRSAEALEKSDACEWADEKTVRPFSGTLDAHLLVFTDAALVPAAALRVAMGTLPDGTAKRLKATAESRAWLRSQASGQPPSIVVTTGSGNVGSGAFADMAEAGFAAEASALCAETGRTSASEVPLLHFAAGSIGRLFEVGRTMDCLRNARNALNAQNVQRAQDALRPEQTMRGCSGVRYRTVPFFSPGSEARFAAALFTGDAWGFGAKTLVVATDLPISPRVLEFLADDLQLSAFGRWPGREAIGDALLILSTGAAALRGVEAIDSASDPRLEPLAAGFRAAMFPALRAPISTTVSALTNASHLLHPGLRLPDLPLRFLLSGAAGREEAERVRRFVMLRLLSWRAEVARQSAALVDDLCSKQRAQFAAIALDALYSTLWSALFLDAKIPGLERKPINVRVNDASLVAAGALEAPLATGRIDPAWQASALANAFERSIASFDQVGQELVIECSLGRGRTVCEARI